MGGSDRYNKDSGIFKESPLLWAWLEERIVNKIFYWARNTRNHKYGVKSQGVCKKKGEECFLLWYLETRATNIEKFGWKALSTVGHAAFLRLTNERSTLTAIRAVTFGPFGFVRSSKSLAVSTFLVQRFGAERELGIDISLPWSARELNNGKAKERRSRRKKTRNRSE